MVWPRDRGTKWRPILAAVAPGAMLNSYRLARYGCVFCPSERGVTTQTWAWDWWASIGSPKWVCSPMVDQSERAFRLLCKKHGVQLSYTPMIHAEPFASDRAYQKTFFDAWESAKLKTGVVECLDADRPLIAQLGGDDPKTILRAARIIEPYVDAIDINFGCPTEDARKGGHKSHSPRCRRFGAYLLPSVPLVERIVGTVAAGLRRVPVTAKIRLRENTAKTLEVATAIQQAGAVALCVHGRTVKQRPKYADRDLSGAPLLASNWTAIREVRDAVGIPVIANGGVETKEEAIRCLEETGAAAVMSAEALLENPSLFEDIEDEADLENQPDPAVRQMLRLSREFLDLCEIFPSPLKYPPTKSHLFKILHRVMGADQALARQHFDAGEVLTLEEELKLALMRCKVDDFEAIRKVLDLVELEYSKTPRPELGVSWYRRWRSLTATRAVTDADYRSS